MLHTCSVSQTIDQLEKLSKQSLGLFYNTGNPIPGSIGIVLTTLRLALASDAVHELAAHNQRFSQKLLEELQAASAMMMEEFCSNLAPGYPPSGGMPPESVM